MQPMGLCFARLRLLLPLLLSLAACAPSGELRRRGDEIMVAGRLFHTGTPVVLWTDPGGYDGYRVERRFVPFDKSDWAATAAAGGIDTPNRFGLRRAGLSEAEIDRVRGGGWDLPTLRRVVDQFVIHYDAAGTSRNCFRVLHDVRGLSVHFLLDLDGTIYQTLDVKERAWHASIANDRSVGIEIANIGAYGEGERDPFDRWYRREPVPGPPGTVGSTRLRVILPPELGDGGIRTPGFVALPARQSMILGEVRGRTLRQYDFTPQQYDALARLTAALCDILPGIRRDYPRDASGTLLTRTLTPDELAAYHGLLGHFHVQDNKVDPGPAFDWDRVIDGARRGRP